MKFGIHNSSWLDAPDPAEAFEAVKAKAQRNDVETRELFVSDVMPHFAGRKIYRDSGKGKYLGTEAANMTATPLFGLSVQF
jgi:hypothetical protein